MNDLLIFCHSTTVYVTSILVADYALFVCSESDEDSTLPSPDPVQWLRVSRGTRFICGQWAQLVGPSWIASSGVFYGKPDMTDDDTLFDATQIKPFEKLLTYAEDYETLSPEDKEVYRKAICYIGLAYKSIMDGSDEPMATCRRLMALPSRSEPRFIDLLEMKQPRAMAILAHTFACMKLVENEVEWFKGIAERQVPKIYNDLPVGWQPMMVCTRCCRKKHHLSLELCVIWLTTLNRLGQWRSSTAKSPASRQRHKLTISWRCSFHRSSSNEFHDVWNVCFLQLDGPEGFPVDRDHKYSSSFIFPSYHSSERHGSHKRHAWQYQSRVDTRCTYP